MALSDERLENVERAIDHLRGDSVTPPDQQHITLRLEDVKWLLAEVKRLRRRCAVCVHKDWSFCEATIPERPLPLWGICDKPELFARREDV